ncbi:MAG: P-II family nitrogen regulator [Sporomusaceae bacterium]|nr:P-II family nitrogen regulator [Sporomusaceae bacterium]
MKEIVAIVRMNKTSATKQALIESGAAGFTAVKVLGRGNLVTDPTMIAARRADLISMVSDEDNKESIALIDNFLNGTSLFPRRLFNIVAQDEDVPKIVQAIIDVNKTDNNVGDGKIFVMPLGDSIRIRTGETGEAAL